MDAEPASPRAPDHAIPVVDDCDGAVRAEGYDFWKFEATFTQFACDTACSRQDTFHRIGLIFLLNFTYVCSIHVLSNHSFGRSLFYTALRPYFYLETPKARAASSGVGYSDLPAKLSSGPLTLDARSRD